MLFSHFKKKVRLISYLEIVPKAQLQVRNNFPFAANNLHYVPKFMLIIFVAFDQSGTIVEVSFPLVFWYLKLVT